MVALVTCLLAVRTVISLQGYLLGDDFAVRYRAASQGWSLQYAFEPYNDHISPIGYSLQWVLQWAFPGSHIALVLSTSVLMAITLSFAAGFAWVLTGRLLAVAITTVTLGFGLLTFEVATWWCVSLYSMTYLAFVALALWGLVRTLRFGTPAGLILVGVIGASLSDSKGFLALILLFGVVAGIDVTGTGALHIAGAWRRMPVVWVIGAATGAGMIALSAMTTSGIQGTLTVGRALGMMRDLWLVNIAPAVFGGPWWWTTVPAREWSPVRVLPATPMAVGLMCLVLCAAGIVFVLRRRPGVAGFVPYAVAYSLATTAVPVLGRAGTDLASAAYRYTYDVVIPVAILLALTIVPLWWQRAEPAVWARLVPVGLLASMTISTVVPAAAWGANESESYVRRAVSGFTSIPEGQVVIPQGVPEDLVPGLLWPYANTSAVLTPQPGSPTFGDVARGSLFGFGSDGTLQTQEVVGPRSLPGPDPGCGYAVTGNPRLIPLDGRLIAWRFMARIAYFSGSDTILHVAVGGQIHSVPLPASELTAVYFPVNGPGKDVLVSIGTAEDTVCVTEVVIGNRVEPGGGSPVPLTPEGLPE